MKPSAAPQVSMRRFASRGELDTALAQRLAEAVREAAAAAIMLAGGSTPGPAYNLVAQHAVHAASGLHIVYSDERYVPPTSDGSNYRLSQPLLSALALPAAQVLRVRTELSLEGAAQDYADRLQGLLSARLPIRWGLLGLGADGHTASLFKPGDLDAARGRLAIPVQRPDGRMAVSITPDWLAHVEEIVFVVAGHDKTTAFAALAARDSKLIAWRAVERCAHVQLWADSQAWPP